jgi:hypothetical protein
MRRNYNTNIHSKRRDPCELRVHVDSQYRQAIRSNHCVRGPVQAEGVVCSRLWKLISNQCLVGEIEATHGNSIRSQQRLLGLPVRNLVLDGRRKLMKDMSRDRRA